MHMHPSLAAALAATLALGLAAPAVAQSKGDMTVGIGIGHVMPKSGNGTLLPGAADVGNNARPTFTFEYFIADNIGIEVLAATPFKHSVTVGGTTVGTVKHLPPTVSLQYHFPTAGQVRPFVGAGVTYVAFFDEDTTAVLGSDIKLKDSWGLSLHAGLDYAISDRRAIRFDLRWMDIDSKVSIGGGDSTRRVADGDTPLGTVNIDPVVMGLSYVIRF